MEKKKVVVFGLIALLLVTFVAGAVVRYASNTSDMDVDISTPFETFINGQDNVQVSVFGGETVQLNTTVENLANANIDVYKATFEIESDDYWNGDEFVSVELTDRGTYVGDILPALCYVRADGTSTNFANIAGENTKIAKLMICSDGSNVDAKYTHPAGSLIDNVVDIKLNPAIAPGDYNIKFCHLFDLTGVC